MTASITPIEGDPTSIEEEAAIWIVNEIGSRFNEMIFGGTRVPATEYNLAKFNLIISEVIRDAVRKFGLLRAHLFRARAVFNDQGGKLTIHLSPFMESIIYEVKVREEQERSKRSTS